MKCIQTLAPNGFSILKATLWNMMGRSGETHEHYIYIYVCVCVCVCVLLIEYFLLLSSVRVRTIVKLGFIYQDVSGRSIVIFSFLCIVLGWTNLRESWVYTHGRTGMCVCVCYMYTCIHFRRRNRNNTFFSGRKKNWWKSCCNIIKAKKAKMPRKEKKKKKRKI